MRVRIVSYTDMANVTIDHEAFLKAYDDHADAIFRHCYFRVYDREKARDLMQECFTKTWQYLVEGKKVDNLRAFLYRVANNLVVDSVRKKKESSLEEMAETGFDPKAGGKDAAHGAELSLVASHIDRLEDRYRHVVRLRYLDDLSPKEIAQALGETENAVSVRIHRGVAMLRTLMNEGDAI